METWHDLAIVYMKLSQWHDVEACLLKSETITYYSAPRLHITGMFTFFFPSYFGILCKLYYF